MTRVLRPPARSPARARNRSRICAGRPSIAGTCARSSRAARSTRRSNEQGRGNNVPGRVRVQSTINGEPQEFLGEPRQSLLECLRDVLGLTGTKEGCNAGNCGACTVVMDERIVTSCLVL